VKNWANWAQTARAQFRRVNFFSEKELANWARFSTEKGRKKTNERVVG